MLGWNLFKFCKASFTFIKTIRSAWLNRTITATLKKTLKQSLGGEAMEYLELAITWRRSGGILGTRNKLIFDVGTKFIIIFFYSGPSSWDP